MNTPPKNIIGIVTGVANHQLADPVISKEIATGLNICFLLIAKRYLEAFVITAPKNKYIKLSGGIIKANIKAEM